MNITFGNYVPGHSFLHRLDPRTKLISSLFLMIFLFFLYSPWSLLAYGLMLLVFTWVSGVPVCKVLKSVRSILFLALFAWVLNLFTVRGQVLWSWGPLSITREGLSLGFRLALRLMYLVITTSLTLTLVTTPIQIADALERLMRPLKKIHFPVHELAMMMSIALRFIPTLAEEADKIMKAQVSRGADFDTGGLRARMKGMVTVLIPLFVSAFKRAEDLALAMEARCYRGGEGRSKMRELHYRKRDFWTFLGLILLVLFFAFLEYRVPHTLFCV